MQEDRPTEPLGFSLLGPLRACRGAAPVALGSPQQQGVLAVLLLRPNGAAGAEDLIDALWGGEPPPAAVTTIRTYVYRLRRALELRPAEPSVLVSAGAGYRLLLPPTAVDVRLVEQSAAAARTATGAGRPDEARRLLDQALARWQGEPLTGVPGPYAQRQRHRLVELRLALLEERLALEVVFGHPGACLPELTALTAEHPLRERPHGLLMWALRRSGRQADALAVYRAVREQLVAELGVEPGPELTALHRHILTGAQEPPTRLFGFPAPSATLRTGAPADLPADSPADPPADPRPAVRPDSARPDPAAPASLPTPAQLPPSSPDFIGRADQIERIGRALTAPERRMPPIVVLAGMGGVGKTTLAVHAAHRARAAFPGGALYADLRGADARPADPADVLAGFLAALGVSPEAVPESEAERSALFRSAVDGRRLLVVLDNARDSAQLQPLLPGAPDCAALVTGRTLAVGRLPALLRLDVAVFTDAEATELLDQVIGAHRRSAEPAAALDLVRACGHLPLAVRIVATRLAARPHWTLRSLSRRLADERRRIDELRVADLTVEAVFELGYRQLTAEQARAFRLASWAEGPDIGLGAATALLDLPERVAEELLESLVDAAMLDSPSAGRYRYHDLLRVFARRVSLATDPAESAGARHRLLGHLLIGCRAAFRLAVPGDPVSESLGAELGTADDGTAGPAGPAFHGLAEARRWADVEAAGAIDLARRLAETAEEPVGAATLLGEQQSDGPSPAELRAAADLLIGLGPLTRAVGGSSALAAARALAAAAVTGGDRYAEGRARFLCGTLLLGMTRLDQAGTEAGLATRAARECGDTLVLRQALNDLGLIAQALGRNEEAIGCFDEVVALAERLGQRSGAVAGTVNAALSRVRCGQAGVAALTCERVLPVARELGDANGTAYTLYVLGLALHQLGRHAEAAARLRECVALAAATGRLDRESLACSRLADTLSVLGRHDEAVREAERAVSISGEGAERNLGYALAALGGALAGAGRPAEARARLTEAHAILVRLGLPEADQVRARLDRVPAGAPAGTPDADRGQIWAQPGPHEAPVPLYSLSS
ncbi:DNA-binding SARP family transcriptional activator/tetratricopeptide (TPR) repeat protein [Kitasatospora sp. GAS204A]|uniref:AfsR/SARP family transcriptional regulator n=1 Tax=unclassified Kitasatospora TaxID=2633591 RepID=UPI002475F043|nr:AfsR/SARP family transcriptional regulator [Kitasatospora sp. GAS204B]MDH6118528.1 DNA-binding SARP family transcriptional activator/tetratricopeptide (TPR) repeat protein [Kitasatospora sp. GAS204B]